jgi:hypothetical protein
MVGARSLTVFIVLIRTHEDCDGEATAQQGATSQPCRAVLVSPELCDVDTSITALCGAATAWECQEEAYVMQKALAATISRAHSTSRKAGSSLAH